MTFTSEDNIYAKTLLTSGIPMYLNGFGSQFTLFQLWSPLLEKLIFSLNFPFSKGGLTFALHSLMFNVPLEN